MSMCRICHTEYYRETSIEPAEPCFCGDMANCSPWDWEGWRGVYRAFRFRLAFWVSILAEKLWAWEG